MLASLRPNPHRELERALGHRFRSRALLLQALTHPSYRHDASLAQRDEPDNQRLEFLGDAALDLAAAHALYLRFPGTDEGVLTRRRAHLVNARTLHERAVAAGIAPHLRLGRGEESSGGRERPGNLADALEAVFGAALLDGGPDAVARMFSRLFGALIDALGEETNPGNPKGALQEWAQRVHQVTPVYRTGTDTGPAHAPEFASEVLLGETVIGAGRGRTKREAETEAALSALSRAGVDGPPGPAA